MVDWLRRVVGSLSNWLLPGVGVISNWLLPVLRMLLPVAVLLSALLMTSHVSGETSCITDQQIICQLCTIMKRMMLKIQSKIVF